MQGRFDDSDTDYTDTRIRLELSNTLKDEFGPMVVNARDGAGARTGYWMKQLATTTTSGRSHYRLPYRALAGVAEAIELSDALSANYQLLGDQIVFVSVPTVGSTLLVTYYIRPSTLVAEQTIGKVLSVDTAAGSVIVNSLPLDRVTAATVLTGDKFDIVHPNGWHELAVANVTATIAGSTLTFASGTDLSDVEVGDYVREADQTDWPCLPEEFHSTLNLLTAANITLSKGDVGAVGKSAALRARAEKKMSDFANLLEPRIKDGRQVFVPTVGVLRGRPSPRWPRTAI